MGSFFSLSTCYSFVTESIQFRSFAVSSSPETGDFLQRPKSSSGQAPAKMRQAKPEEEEDETITELHREEEKRAANRDQSSVIVAHRLRKEEEAEGSCASSGYRTRNVSRKKTLQNRDKEKKNLRQLLQRSSSSSPAMHKKSGDRKREVRRWQQSGFSETGFPPCFSVLSIQKQAYSPFSALEFL
ncbi:hypothetical protein MRB53_013869 [Persea americana]|uniref:Uncharacterized protein n=1 Tax=Persea americana TaxID=3435 RepID=A0ACC2K9U8_PERAE|nr:hypothetical protein MRB53_013869 [Persea americana]